MSHTFFIVRNGVDSEGTFVFVQLSYTETQLDLLALVFTMVKILFTGGALSRVARLIDTVNCARLASDKELHTTLIRNEAAYFGCVSQVLKQSPPPPVPCGSIVSPIFLCGDSHCLSGERVYWFH